MPAPKTISDLVEKFSLHHEAYKSGAYNETQVRREFIDPFFRALGWDIDNEKGYSEVYKEVIHEDAIKVGGLTKAPDYCFRIGGARKFFVEAKRPSIDLKEAVSPAFQLRRYCWSAKLPLSILTDFEEMAVYDGRIRPGPKDKPSVARTLYINYREYVSRWDELVSLFSPDAILKGSFERYAESTKIKKGTATVDEEFLKEIESWRSELARNIALRNNSLTQRELNFAVQQTIDRIIFLRICEDRGIESYGQLMALQNGTNVYERLVENFRRADDRYNSGLFHFKKERERDSPDTLTLSLEIDDKVLKDVFKNLYYPESPYEFSVLSADILGQVYEQFLGKVIRLTDGHRAVIEDKPETKKAGGVYYTPTYIVDFIVRNTLGKMLETKRPKQIAGLSVLDPACGSGSFLIVAYQYLLDWYRDRYIEDGPEKYTKKSRPLLYRGPGGDWRLTTAERKRILLEHIYGVDIDPQAVEVTKLSLLLKVLEGESGESITSQLRLFQERALPDLDSNIKCGNSLVGPDFYEGQQLNLMGMTEEDRLRINVFDWDKEFPKNMKSGGFDIVIGNPPYVRQESLSDFKEYFRLHYEASDGVADLYAYFMEKGVKLLRDKGLFSIIVSSSFLRASYGEPLRRALKKSAAILRIVDFGGLPIFANAKDTYVCIPLLAKGLPQREVEVSKVDSMEIRDLAKHVEANHYLIPQERLSPQAWSLKSNKEADLFAKVSKAGKPLGEYVERKMFYGLKTGFNEAFEVTGEQKTNLIKLSVASKSLIKPFVGGQDIRRYSINDEDRHLIVIPCGWTRQQIAKAKKISTDISEHEAWGWFSEEYPKIAAHLSSFSGALQKRQDKGNYWWELRPCDYYQYLDAPKIIFPDICKGPRFYLDLNGIYLANTAYCLGTDDLYLLGFLNSRLFWFAISNISIPFGVRAGEYRYRLIYQYMEKVPIRVINFSDASDKSRHARIVDLVQQEISLHKEITTARTDHEKNSIKRQIEAINRQIEKLFYELYGLTKEEIEIVEGS